MVKSRIKLLFRRKRAKKYRKEMKMEFEKLKKIIAEVLNMDDSTFYNR